MVEDSSFYTANLANELNLTLHKGAVADRGVSGAGGCPLPQLAKSVWSMDHSKCEVVGNADSESVLLTQIMKVTCLNVIVCVST
jgi:hypothetical protein